MEKLFSIYGLYDTLSFLFPGMTVVGSAVFALVSLGKANLDNSSKYGVGFSVFFVLVSYLAGHIVQAISNYFEKKIYNLKNVSYPSDNILSENSKHFSKSLRQKIYDAALNYFDLQEDSTPSDIFRLCYSLILQKGIGSRAETMNAMYGFYRGMTLSGALSFLLFLITTVLFWPVHRVVFTALSIMFLVMTFLFYLRFLRFGIHFADYVYRDFYAFYCADKRKPHLS